MKPDWCSAGQNRLPGLAKCQLHPSEQDELTRYGLGITNIAPRATGQAAELADAELRDGAVRLRALAEARRPRFIAVLGVTAYRTAFAHPKAVVGQQDDLLGPARLWILPNPSGLNAHWLLPALSEAFTDLRLHVESDPPCLEHQPHG